MDFLTSGPVLTPAAAAEFPYVAPAPPFKKGKSRFTLDSIYVKEFEISTKPKIEKDVFKYLEN